GAVAPDWSNPPVQTPALDALYRELQQTEAEILAQRRVYREGSQELAPFESQAAALREAMRKELQKAFSDLEGQRESLAERAADLLLGLVFGIGLALAREAFRHTIRTPRDVIHRLRLPVMGMIPRRM